MKIFTEPVVCSVCGGAGLARPRDAAREWLGAELAHADPRACQEVLARREAELAKREAALQEAGS